MTSAEKTQVVPTYTVVYPQWAVICDQLDAGEMPVYSLTEKQTRALNVWALKNRSYPVFYKSVEGEARRLSKTSFRKLK